MRVRWSRGTCVAFWPGPGVRSNSILTAVDGRNVGEMRRRIQKRLEAVLVTDSIRRVAAEGLAGTLLHITEDLRASGQGTNFIFFEHLSERKNRHIPWVGCMKPSLSMNSPGVDPSYSITQHSSSSKGNFGHYEYFPQKTSYRRRTHRDTLAHHGGARCTRTELVRPLYVAPWLCWSNGIRVVFWDLDIHLGIFDPTAYQQHWKKSWPPQVPPAQYLALTSRDPSAHHRRTPCTRNRLISGRFCTQRGTGVRRWRLLRKND